MFHGKLCLDVRRSLHQHQAGLFGRLSPNNHPTILVVSCSKPCRLNSERDASLCPSMQSFYAPCSEYLGRYSSPEAEAVAIDAEEWGHHQALVS